MQKKEKWKRFFSVYVKGVRIKVKKGDSKNVETRYKVGDKGFKVLIQKSLGLISPRLFSWKEDE